jgi:hypothetical protein
MALVDSSIETSIYYRGQLSPSSAHIGSEYKSATQYSAELLNMKNHGVDNPTMYDVPSGDYFSQALSARQSVTPSGGALYSVATPLAYADVEDLNAAVPSILSSIQAAGFSDYFLYGRDEVTGEDLTAQRTSWIQCHSLGAKVIAAGSDINTYALVGDVLDIYIQAGMPNNTDLPSVPGCWHGAGHKIYTYSNPQVGAENPYLYRRNYGVLLWASGYDGVMDYAYQHSFGKPWNDFDHATYRDHMFTYPTVNGVIDTIAWEGYREAHDDLRYIATLEQYIDHGLCNSSSTVRANAATAKAYLDDLKSDIQTNMTESTDAAYPGYLVGGSDSGLDTMRATIVDYIETLPTPTQITTGSMTGVCQ